MGEEKHSRYNHLTDECDDEHLDPMDELLGDNVIYLGIVSAAALFICWVILD